MVSRRCRAVRRRGAARCGSIGRGARRRSPSDHRCVGTAAKRDRRRTRAVLTRASWLRSRVQCSHRPLELAELDALDNVQHLQALQSLYIGRSSKTASRVRRARGVHPLAAMAPSPHGRDSRRCRARIPRSRQRSVTRRTPRVRRRDELDARARLNSRPLAPPGARPAGHEYLREAGVSLERLCAGFPAAPMTSVEGSRHARKRSTALASLAAASGRARCSSHSRRRCPAR